MAHVATNWDPGILQSSQNKDGGFEANNRVCLTLHRTERVLH